MVGRLLPFREKRTVGPFAFIDHMGPVQMHDYENFDVPPHPHIGLSTLTYLIEGSIMHKDILGSEVEKKRRNCCSIFSYRKNYLYKRKEVSSRNRV